MNPDHTPMPPAAQELLILRRELEALTKRCAYLQAENNRLSNQLRIIRRVISSIPQH